MDRFLNREIKEISPHVYKSVDEWNDVFKKYAFRIVEVNEIQPKDVRHGFFVLEKILFQD